MTTEAALALLLGLIEAAVRIAGPLLAVSLTAGLIVGILQAATQLNEGSVTSACSQSRNRPGTPQ